MVLPPPLPILGGSALQPMRLVYHYPCLTDEQELGLGDEGARLPSHGSESLTGAPATLWAWFPSLVTCCLWLFTYSGLHSTNTRGLLCARSRSGLWGRFPRSQLCSHLGWVIPCGGGCAGRCRRLSSSPGLPHSRARSVSRCCQMFCGVGTPPPP